MSDITPNEFRKVFPNASQAAARRNQAGGQAQCSELEHPPKDEPVAEIGGEAGDTIGGLRCNSESDRPRIRLTYTLYLTRPLDPENCATKFFTDCLRYAGILFDDRPQDIDLRIQQVRVVTRKEEGTGIEISPITTTETKPI